MSAWKVRFPIGPSRQAWRLECPVFGHSAIWNAARDAVHCAMESMQSDMGKAVWQISLLGGLRARHAGQEITHFQTQKTASLLAYLASFPQKRHSREVLIDLLWPDAELEAGRNRLSQALGWLRLHLESAGIPRSSVLFADRYNVGLHPECVITDVAAFEAALRSAAANTETETLAALTSAAELYQGEFLPGFYDDWIVAERQRLLTLYLSALRRLILSYEARQEWQTALVHARRALTADPLDEEVNVVLIRLLAQSGQPALALRHYREWERVLKSQLEAAPSPAARALADKIRQDLTPAPGSLLQAPVPAGKSPPPSLPSPMTRFFGREAEIEQVQSLITSEGTRLVTLTGLGGAGKTRLAIEMARRLSPYFEGEVWFLPLADLSDARHIPAALADLLGLARAGNAPLLEKIDDALSSRSCLLVLDNMEHLIEGGTAFARELLNRLPLLVLLITSRQRLGLEGEREIPVPPLSIPSGALLQNPQEISRELLMQNDSARLFVERAQAARPTFAVTNQNAAAIARLCARLEGLPLALELCAAWAQTLTPTQMLTQLGRRFDLLVSRRADIPPRHRTLRAALEYSYLLLPPDLQQVFVRLSVFRGGWTLDAAEAVCDTLSERPDASPLRMLTFLTELRERSLIVAEETEGDAMRYRMVESLREFATEQQTMAEEEPLRKRHAEYFLQIAEHSEPEQADWLSRLEAEHDNLRQALNWALAEGDASTGLRLAAALTPFWDMHGYPGEGQDWLEQLLALPSDEKTALEARSLRARALNASGHLARSRARFDEAAAFVEEALPLWRELEDLEGMASSLQILATLAYSREEYDEARRYVEEALRLARQIGNQQLEAGALVNMGNIDMEQSRWSDAWQMFSEGLNLYRAQGNRKRIADTLNNLGLVARYQNDLKKARALLEESLILCRELTDRSGTAITLLNLGAVHRLEGRFSQSHSVLDEAAALAVEVDNKRAVAWCARELGHLAIAEKRYETGLRLLSSAEDLRLALGMTFNPADPDELASHLAEARATLDEAEFADSWTPGSGRSATESYARVLELLHTRP